MAVFTENELNRELNAGRLAPVYLLYGSEGYLKQHYAQKICSLAVPGDAADFNLNRLDGAESGIDAVYDCVSTLPMMGGRTCTLVKDFPLQTFVGERGKVSDELAAVLDAVCDEAVLVFWMDTVEVDEKAARWKKTVDLIAGHGVSAKLGERTPQDLARMLAAGAAKRGCTLSPSDAAYFVDTAGADLSLLRSELDKVCAYVGSGVIGREVIDEVVTVTAEAKIFQLSRQITARNADAAFENLENLFRLREEPIVISATLSKAFVDMYRVKAAKEKGVRLAAVAEAFPSAYKGRDFILRNAERDGAHYDLSRLKTALGYLADADRRLKSTGEDKQMILEELVAKLLRV
ncbi:MAG: DNA polymerase III subunit delta [Clostridia bacterium]|nr:DNA polymerase III subunit delta [Clostridia bacterium]